MLYGLVSSSSSSLALSGQPVRAVGVSIVQGLLGLFQEGADLRGRDFLFGRERAFDTAQTLFRRADQIRRLVLGFFSHRAVTGGQLTNGRRCSQRSRCLRGSGLRRGLGTRLRAEKLHQWPGSGRSLPVWSQAAWTCASPSSVGAAEARARFARTAAAKAKPSGVSVFSCCCDLVCGLSVPFPVCNGGACACGGGEELLWNRHPVQKTASRVKRRAYACCSHPLGSLATIDPAELLPSGIKYPRALLS